MRMPIARRLASAAAWLHDCRAGWSAVLGTALAAPALALLGARPAWADFEPDALMMRYPDVSANQIVFSYDNNLWIAPRSGGTAEPLTSPAGTEFRPQFSPDGQEIAYTASYDGSGDIYLIDAQGGIPMRLTRSPLSEVVTGFTPTGDVAFFAWGSDPHWETHLYTVGQNGGAAKEVKVGYCSNCSYSGDGEWLAMVPWTREFANWNRYMGGTASDVWLFNLKTNASKKITDWGGCDDLPMFDGDRVFYLSDQGPEHRRNIWVYNTKDGSRKQVTHFTEYETKWPNIGPGAIVLENGGTLYLLDLRTLEASAVHIALPGDRPHLRPHLQDQGSNIMSIALSPKAKRVVVSARGDLWTLPAEKGFPTQLTRSDASAERDATWSPDGKWIAYFSDVNGEYDLYMRPADGTGEEKRLTSNADCFRFNPRFSPDSKKIFFSDKAGNYWIHLIDEQETLKMDKSPGGGRGPSAEWAKDSNWLCYSIDDEKTRAGVVKLYNLKERKGYAVTSPMFDSGAPTFDLSGDYLYFSTQRSISPSYGDLGDWGEHFFANSTVLAVLPLRKDVKSPWAPKNDAEEVKKDEEKKDSDEDKKDGAGAKDGEDKPDAGAGEAEGDKKDEAKADAATDEEKDSKGEGEDADKKDEEKKEPELLKIDTDNMEARAIQFPLEPGNYYALAGGDKKLFYIRAPRTGSSGGDNQWCMYEFGDEPKENVLLGGVGGYELTPDASKALVAAQGGWYITGAGPGAKLDKRINTGGLVVEVDPRTEWKQMVTDEWRIFRDLFYDPNMHGVDWDAVLARSLKLLDSAASRNDLGYIIAELISEVNSSHTYPSIAGEDGPWQMGYGLLGCDFALGSDADGKPGWQISKLLHGAAWELDARSPLDAPGVDAQAGDFLLAINGVPVSLHDGPYALLQGKAGQTLEITVNEKAALDGKERKSLVTATWDEGELRLRGWIEDTRQYIYEKSGGKIGYIYVRDTGGGGEADFERQFIGQHEMDALIVDERWNAGGLSPEPMIAVMSRKVRNYWATRDGTSWRTPWLCHPGPQVLLMNEKAGSGGDSFPFLWRSYGLGPMIGTRTWGGLIGINGAPRLIDGSGTTVPTFGIYEIDGTWAIEGHGVDPDIEVNNDPTTLASGKDNQVDKAIEVLLKELETQTWHDTPKPPYPDRSGMGIQESEK